MLDTLSLIIISITLLLSTLGCTSADQNGKTEQVQKIIAHKTKGNTMEHLTLESFKEKICECGIETEEKAEWNFKGKLPAVIDFYADWCGPCKMVAPILEELSKEYKGKVDIYKINTEQQQQLAGMFGIRSIPSVLFIPADGQPQMTAGALPKAEYKKLINDIIGVE